MGNTVLSLTSIALFVLISAQASGGSTEAETTGVTSSSNSPHSFKVIEDGVAALEERLRMIESAKESIDIEYFIFEADKSGLLISQTLAKKAQEGKKVRLIVDNFFTKPNKILFEELKNAGVEVKVFNKSKGPLGLKGIHYRDHRKLLIVDGKALLGGRNIGDEYFDMSKKYNFLDRDISVQGPIVTKIRESFEEFWIFSEPIETEPLPKKVNYLKEIGPKKVKVIDNRSYESAIREYREIRAKTAKELQSLSTEGKVLREKIKEVGGPILDSEPTFTSTASTTVSFVTDNPEWKNGSRGAAHQLVFQKISEATTSVLIENPYFIPKKEEKEILIKLAKEKGVPVEFLTSSMTSSEAPITTGVVYLTTRDLIGAGIVAYAYGGKPMKGKILVDPETGDAKWAIHAKTAVIDKKDIYLGSYSLDPRSKHLNSELVLEIENFPALAMHLEEKMRTRISQSGVRSGKGHFVISGNCPGASSFPIDQGSANIFHGLVYLLASDDF